MDAGDANQPITQSAEDAQVKFTECYNLKVTHCVRNQRTVSVGTTFEFQFTSRTLKNKF